MLNARNLVGQTLGQYELQELLGRGGMADVYLGYQANLKRHVAVKVLAMNLVGEEGYVTRFIREAEIAASLEHPHIVPIIDFGTQASINVNYVVMRLLRGGSLAERMRQRRASDELLSLGETAALLNQIAGALDYAHKRNIVHRDIKPSNIMFDTQGTAFLVDFGIAKPLDVAQQMTMPGTSMGTVAYMAPEQWRGDKLTAAVDQYAMGLIIYSLVTGQQAFEVPSDAPYALMHKHINEMPTPAHEVNPDLPEAVDETIAKAIAKRPEDRYPTLTAFSQAFSKAIEGVEGKERTTGFFTFQLPPKPTLDALPRTPTPVTGGTRSAGQPPRRLGGEADEEARPRGGNSRRLMIGALALALVAVAVIAFLLILRGGEQGGRQSELEQTQAALNPTLTAIAVANSGGASPTPNETAVAAEMTLTAAAQIIIPSGPTPSETQTAQPEATETETLTSTPTATETPAGDVIVILTPPPDVSATASAAFAQSATARAAQTSSARTATSAYFQGATKTATLWTQTPTPSDTATATHTPTATRSATPTVTPSSTATATATATATLTPSNTPTRTNTPRATNTLTATPTQTASATATATRTATATLTATASATVTATATRTNTATATPSPAPTVFGGGTGVIAYGSNRNGVWQIFLGQIGSTAEQVLTLPNANNFMPRWSPDGRNIAFVSDRDGQSEIYRMAVTGTGQQRLTDSTGGGSEWPRWSPDGQQVAYETRTNDNLEVFVMGADGSNPINLTNNAADDRQPSWSPDGQQIAFISNRDNQWHVYIMNADGSHTIQLTKGDAEDREPLWSPDGEHIVFRSNRGGAADFYLIAPDGSGLRQLTTIGNCFGPSWSPDGRLVAFHHTLGDNSAQILFIDIETGEVTEVTPRGASWLNAHPAWQP